MSRWKCCGELLKLNRICVSVSLFTIHYNFCQVLEKCKWPLIIVLHYWQYTDNTDKFVKLCRIFELLISSNLWNYFTQNDAWKKFQTYIPTAGNVVVYNVASMLLIKFLFAFFRENGFSRSEELLTTSAHFMYVDDGGSDNSLVEKTYDLQTNGIQVVSWT